MKPYRLLAAATALAAILGPALARADGFHHGHSRAHFGFYFGAPIVVDPFYAPRYYYPPYPGYPGYYAPYYAPGPVITLPAAPPVYVEQAPQQASSGALPSNYWYWCANPKGYYPTVNSCPGGWTPVGPQPGAPSQPR